MTDARSLREMPRSEAMRLLASVPVGRLVFTHQALPSIRPVNHLVLDDKIMIALTPGSAFKSATGPDGIVVAYEADLLDMTARTGWTVIVVGLARLVTDPELAAQHRSVLRPWLGGPMNDILAISSELVTGYWLQPA